MLRIHRQFELKTHGFATHAMQMEWVSNAHNSAGHRYLDDLIGRQSINTAIGHELLSGVCTREDLKEYWNSWGNEGIAVDIKSGHGLNSELSRTRQFIWIHAYKCEI